MNIQILNNFDEQKIYSAFQNIVIEFGLDQQPSSPIDKAEITGLGFPVVLSASPRGKFYFNFRMFSKSYITYKNLQDPIDYEVDEAIISTFSKQDDYFLLHNIISIIISLKDKTTISKNFNLKYYRAVLDKFRFKQYLFANPYEINTEFEPLTLYIFDGYPIDIGVFTKGMLVIRIATTENYNDSTSSQVVKNNIVEGYQFTRVILTNGNEFIQTVSGATLLDNISELYVDDTQSFEKPTKIYNVKTIYNCKGHYLKWLNRSGDYSYFLFSDRYEEEISANKKGSINNYFKNNDELISPSISTGKESNRELTLFKNKVDQEMRYFLSDIIDSPKVYYYTGFKGKAANEFDWVEVNITDSSFEINRPKENTWNVFLDVKFPMYQNQVI